jgi:DNA (cytosine-5)-methyltransferase 1
MAVRGGGAIRWPEATHGPGLAHLKRTARDSVIDWSIKGKSIHGRKKPLSPNTLRRIGAGLRKFGGVNAGPFLVMLYGTNDARTLDRPVDAPLPTVTGAHRGEMAICEPFIIPVNYGERAGQSPRVHGVDAPMPTVVGSNTHALVEPFILGQQSCSAPRSTDAPLPTVSCGGAIALCEPFIVKYYGTGTAVGVDKPLDTVTTKDRFMLVEPRTGRVVAELDILFRMLQPHELAAAQSFPRDYVFTGNKSEQTKQIGNAVPVELARAHVRALLA